MVNKIIVVNPEPRKPLIAVVVKLLALPMFTEPFPLQKTTAGTAPEGCGKLVKPATSAARTGHSVTRGAASQLATG